VPRKTANEDDTPRRRRRAGAAAIEAEAERGLVMRMLLHSPKDMIAGVLAFAAVSAIIANAMFLQAGRHPSPLFGTVVAVPAAVPAVASPLPRPRPVEATTKAVDTLPPEPKAVEPKSDSRSDFKSDSRTDRSEFKSESRAADAMTNLVKATAVPQTVPAPVARPPVPVPAASRNDPASAPRRIAAVQRTLTEYGYGQLKPTGTVGSETQAAIQKFERDRKIPVTGQVSDRLVRELAAMTGKAID
jgi:Putative peptidoglycan binding domain